MASSVHTAAARCLSCSQSHQSSRTWRKQRLFPPEVPPLFRCYQHSGTLAKILNRSLVVITARYTKLLEAILIANMMAKRISKNFRRMLSGQHWNTVHSADKQRPAFHVPTFWRILEITRILDGNNYEVSQAVQSIRRTLHCVYGLKNSGECGRTSKGPEHFCALLDVCIQRMSVLQYFAEPFIVKNTRLHLEPDNGVLQCHRTPRR